MERLQGFWNSGFIGKIVLIGAGALGLFSICCVALVAIGLASPQPAIAPSLAISTLAAVAEAATLAPEETSASGSASATIAAIPSTTIPTKAPSATPEPFGSSLPTSAPALIAEPVGYVSHAMLGDAWPLSIEEGVIACVQGAVVFRAAGETYALNGTAQGRRGREGWKDIKEITLPDPKIEGLIKSVQPLVFRGLELC